MSESDLRLIAVSGDSKSNLREIEIAVQHTPDDSFAGHEFGHFDLAAMDILVVVRELAELIGVALVFSRPPSANIVDGRKDLFR